jgi:hypothetical protein
VGCGIAIVDRLVPDEAFADLFTGVGRRSVPPSVVATVMVVQRLEGLSDREAVEQFCFRFSLAVRGRGRWLRHGRHGRPAGRVSRTR